MSANFQGKTTRAAVSGARPCCWLALLLWGPIGSEAFALGLSPGQATRCGSGTRRHGRAAMLEAFDLLPVVDCLKLDDMDTVNACMDKLTPWLEIAQGGEVTFSQAAVNGFIGGSVGVVGTVISTMIKKEEVKDRLKCVYCDGSGQILCGHCLGLRYVRGTDAQGAPINVKCPNCEGTGTVVCINCQGSGMSVPEDFFQVMGDPEVGFTEEDYIGLFDEAPIPKAQPPAVPDLVDNSPEPAATAASAAPASPAMAGSDADPRSSKPSDYTGGMG